MCQDEEPCHYACGAKKITRYDQLMHIIDEEPERLLNSRSGRIHLFPGIPAWMDVAFEDFRTRGGFHVSASHLAGEVRNVRITSAQDIPCHLMNPWPEKQVQVFDLTADTVVPHTLDTSNRVCILFQTEKDHSYIIQPEA